MHEWFTGYRLPGNLFLTQTPLNRFTPLTPSDEDRTDKLLPLGRSLSDYFIPGGVGWRVEDGRGDNHIKRNATL